LPFQGISEAPGNVGFEGCSGCTCNSVAQSLGSDTSQVCPQELQPDRGDMDTRTNAKTTDHSLDYVGTFGAGCSIDLRQLAMNCQPVTQSWATATLAATIAACTLPIGTLAPNRRAFVLFGRGNSLSRVNYAEQLYQACRVTLARASPAHSSDEYQLTHAISLRSCKRR
jgi:hypothetical protein